MCTKDLNTFQLDEAVVLIVKASARLQCPIRTKCKALFIYHQFKRCVDEIKYDPYIVGAACINLSVKSNEENIDLDSILVTFFWLFENGVCKSILDEKFKGIKNSLIKMESIILRMIDFSLNHQLAHDYISYFLHDLHDELTSFNIWDIANENCMRIASDFYLSNKCLNYKADEIALATLQSALYLSGLNRDKYNRLETCLKHLKDDDSKKLDIIEDIFTICEIGPIAEKNKQR